MSGECDKCTILNHFTDALEAMEGIDEVSFYVWKTQDKKAQKVTDTLSGEDFAERLETGIIEQRMKTHAYNIYWQYSELKHLKKTLGGKNVILSVDFSRNYDNKQLCEFQSAYFGHECFTIFTAACYVHKDVVCNGKAKFDKEFGLNVIPIVIISNETTHDRDVAFTNNQKLISIVQDISPDITNFHFWSDGCAGQFRSRYVFRSFSYYPQALYLTWDYGEAHHFKGMYQNYLKSVLEFINY